MARMLAYLLLRLQSTPERRLVETGRVCLVNFGKYCGELVCIINVIDGRRVLIDSIKEKGVARQVPLHASHVLFSCATLLVSVESVMKLFFW